MDRDRNALTHLLSSVVGKMSFKQADGKLFFFFPCLLEGVKNKPILRAQEGAV